MKTKSLAFCLVFAAPLAAQIESRSSGGPVGRLSSPSLGPGASPVTETWTAGAGGVTANTLVQTDNSSPLKIVAAVTGVYGVAMSTAAAGGAVEVARYGTVNCLIDTGGATAGHLAVIGTSTVTYCRDSGQTASGAISMGARIIGVFRSSAAAGATALVELTPAHFGTQGGGGAWGSITGTLSDQTDLNTALAARLVASANLADVSSALTARTNLGLGNVENTALSTWAGSTNLVTLGTITSGTWRGVRVGLLYGGTNADLSGTGGAHFFLRQNSAGAAIDAIRPACADLSDAGTGCAATLPAFPAGTIAGTTDTQTLSSKTLASPSLGAGSSPVTETWMVGAGGVTANTLVQTDTSAPLKIVAATTSAYGVAMSTVSAAGSVEVARAGTVNCVVDNGGAAAGHLAIAGAGSPVNCKDSGQTSSAAISNGTRIVGVFRSSVSAGQSALVELTPSHFGTLVVPSVALSAGLYSGTYTSGITATGTAGQTCTLGSLNGGGSSAAVAVALTGTNAIAAGTALVVTAAGSGYTSAPTSSTASSGTATCSGTVVIATVLSVADPGGASAMLFNPASGPIAFALPAGIAGYQRCYRNATGNSGVMTIAVATGNSIDLNGANGTSGTGTLVSAGALGDAVCLVSDATNHWYAYAGGGGGPWTNN